MQYQHGFTLLELMTTIAVAVILVTVAVPSMGSVRDNSRQAGAINEFVSAIHLARSTAITQNSRVTICASDDGAQCGGSGWQDGFIVFRDVDGSQSVNGAETVLTAGSVLDNLSVKAAQLGTAFTYRANGRTTLPANGSIVGSLTFCDNRGSKYARTLQVDLAGRPRSLDPGQGGGSC